MTSLITLTPTPSISISLTPDYLSDTIQAIYVFLTLVIAIAAIYSINQSRKQSQDTLKAVYVQIDANKKQAQEALYAQNRPIIICMGFLNPIAMSSQHVAITLNNVGLAVATNAWGILSFGAPPGLYTPYSFAHPHIFVPNNSTEIAFNVAGKLTFKNSEIEGYSFAPQKLNSIVYIARAIITYQDIFNNKYLSIFDYNTDYGWRQITLQPIAYTLDEINIREDNTN